MVCGKVVANYVTCAVYLVWFERAVYFVKAFVMETIATRTFTPRLERLSI